MSNDNEQHSDPSLSEELSALQDYFLPDGVLIKGVETLSEMKDKFLELDGALSELARTANLSAEELKTIAEEAFRLGDAAGRTEMETLSYISSAIQAGHNLKDAFDLTEEALKMANISPGIDSAGTAIEHIQSILDGFGKNTGFAATIMTPSQAYPRQVLWILTLWRTALPNWQIPPQMLDYLLRKCWDFSLGLISL